MKDNIQTKFKAVSLATKTVKSEGWGILMSDEIGHYCGIALVRLKKPLAYYIEKYGSPLWGFNQLFLLMEKQHNRGQDGAGIGSMKLNMPPGEAFMFRERSTSSKALSKIFGGQQTQLDNL